MTNPQNIILAGVCGSTAQNLATASSDEDVLGVFVTPTSDFWGFDKPDDSVVTTNPDSTFHEVRKMLLLALKSNPTVLELLWLPEHTVVTEHGQRLLNARESFLSAETARNAFIGFSRFQRNMVEPFIEAPAGKVTKRTLKSARHMFRVLETGRTLYETGHLNVAVADRQWYLEVMPLLSVRAMLKLADELEADFRAITSTPLPDAADSSIAEQLLRDIRRDMVTA